MFLCNRNNWEMDRIIHFSLFSPSLLRLRFPGNRFKSGIAIFTWWSLKNILIVRLISRFGPKEKNLKSERSHFWHYHHEILWLLMTSNLKVFFLKICFLVYRAKKIPVCEKKYKLAHTKIQKSKTWNVVKQKWKRSPWVCTRRD